MTVPSGTFGPAVYFAAKKCDIKRGICRYTINKVIRALLLFLLAFFVCLSILFLNNAIFSKHMICFLIHFKIGNEMIIVFSYIPYLFASLSKCSNCVCSNTESVCLAISKTAYQIFPWCIFIHPCLTEKKV